MGKFRLVAGNTIRAEARYTHIARKRLYITLNSIFWFFNNLKINNTYLD